MRSKLPALSPARRLILAACILAAFIFYAILKGWLPIG